MEPYRPAAARCEMCLGEVKQDDLAPLGGLAACGRCRDGHLDGVKAAWGFEVETKYYDNHVPGEPRNHHLRIGVRRPTWLWLDVRLSRCDPGGTPEELAEDGLQQAIEHTLAIPHVNDVMLAFEWVWLWATRSGPEGFSSEMIDSLRSRTAALAVHVERVARRRSSRVA